MQTSITPGTEWLDAAGKPIQAHGGSLIYDAGTFYWYGENKEHTTGNTEVWHWGIRCYSSSDLYNWRDEGLIIEPVLDDEAALLHPSKSVDRPHIIRHPERNTYACWLKVMLDEHRQVAVTLEADHLLGPYRLVDGGFTPCGLHFGDFDLVTDHETGRAFAYFEHPHSELICADLNDDYTGVSGHFTRHFPRQIPLVREAPSYFHRHGQHYLITSGTSGYFPNPSEAAKADAYHGPWRLLGNPHPDDTTGTSFRSQVSSVFKHPHKRDLYIALADRWLPELTAEESNQTELFRQLFTEGEDPSAALAAAPPGLDNVNTSIARYVWLPIEFDNGHPVIRWRDEWRVEDFD